MNREECLALAREVLDAIALEQIEESHYQLHFQELPPISSGEPFRQVHLIYDKRDQTYKGFLPF